MKYRYLMFGYDYFYPSGGMQDIYEKTDDEDLIKELIELWKVEPDHDIIQVYDTELDEVVYLGQGNIDYDINHDNFHSEDIYELGSWVGEPIKEGEWNYYKK